MLKTEQLRYLVELEKTTSFHKCAENLFLSQPAISLSIRNLEKELGVSLFDRSSSGVYPTEIGKKVIQQAKIILSDIEQLYQLCSIHNIQQQEFTLKELHISSVSSFSSVIMPKLLPLLYRDFPETYFSFHVHTHETFLPFISDDPYNIGFCYIWDEESNLILQKYTELRATRLFKVSFHLATAKNVSFTVPRIIDLTQNSALPTPIPYIAYTENTYVTNRIQQALLEYQIIQPIFQASFPHLFNAYISQGLAAGIILKLGANIYLSNMEQTLLSFSPIQFEKECSLYLFYNQALPEPVHQTILRYLQLCFSRL